MLNTIRLNIEKALKSSDNHLYEGYLSFILSFFILLYIFLPFRLGTDFIFQKQTELLVVITALSTIGCTAIILIRILSSKFLINFTRFDLLIFIYFLFLLLQMLFIPVDKEYIFKILCLISLYFLFSHIPVKLTIGLLYLFPIFAVFQIIYGYYSLTEPWQGFSDITGSFGNTGIFGGFIALGFVTALGLLLLTKRYKYPVTQFALCILLLSLIAQLIYIQSRAAWVASVIGVVFLLFPIIRKLSLRKISFIIAFLLIVGVLFSIRIYNFKKDSANGRLLIWTVSWKMFCDKPLVGSGVGGFQKNYMIYQGEYFKNHLESPWSDLADDTFSPFNEFLKVAVEQGIVGITFVSVIFFTAFSKRNKRNLKYNEIIIVRLLEGILIVFFIFSLFSYPLKYIQFQIILMFCFAGLSNFQYKKELHFSKIVLKSTAILIITYCSFLMFLLSNHLQITRQWNMAIAISPRNKDPAIKEFCRIYPSLKRNALFLFIYGENLNVVQRYAESIDLLEDAMKICSSYHTILRLGEIYMKINEYEKAQTAFETASNMIPSAFMPHYNLVLLSVGQQDYEQASIKAKEILNKKIKIDSPSVDKIRKEIQIILNDTLRLE